MTATVPDYRGKRVVVTGSSSGIGAAASYVNGVDLPVDGGFWAAQTLAGRFH